MKKQILLQTTMALMMALLCSSMVMAQGPQLFGYNDKDAELITIKNTSPDSADDFHLAVKVPLPGLGGTPKIKKVVFVPGAAGQTGAFKDTSFSPPYKDNNNDWGADKNNFKIPKDGSFRIQLWGNGYDKDNTYLTHGGTPISTNGLKIKMEINKSGGGGSGSIKIKNEDGSGIILQGVVMHINNTNMPFDSVTYSPTGTAVPGIPNFLMINPGDSVMYPYNGNLPGNWMTLHFIAAKNTAPNDLFEMGAAANDVISSPVPTLSQWGLIALCALMLGIGLFFVRGRVV